MLTSVLRYSESCQAIAHRIQRLSHYHLSNTGWRAIHKHCENFFRWASKAEAVSWSRSTRTLFCRKQQRFSRRWIRSYSTLLWQRLRQKFQVVEIRAFVHVIQAQLASWALLQKTTTGVGCANIGSAGLFSPGPCVSRHCTTFPPAWCLAFIRTKIADNCAVVHKMMQQLVWKSKTNVRSNVSARRHF